MNQGWRSIYEDIQISLTFCHLCLLCCHVHLICCYYAKHVVGWCRCILFTLYYQWHFSCDVFFSSLFSYCEYNSCLVDTDFFCCDYAKFDLRFMHLRMCATLPFPELRLTEIVCVNVFYVCIFIPFCSDSFIWFWLETYFLIGIVTLHLLWFCTMIDVEQEAGQFSNNMAGTEKWPKSCVMNVCWFWTWDTNFLQPPSHKYVWITVTIKKTRVVKTWYLRKIYKVSMQNWIIYFQL